MKIYTNEQHQIIAYDTIPERYAYEYDVDASFKGRWCDACFFGYKYEPEYKRAVNEKNEELMDAFGNPVPELNEKGEKTFLGMSFHPFVDMNTLNRIQAEHDAQEAQTVELMEAALDNDYRLSMMELGL